MNIIGTLEHSDKISEKNGWIKYSTTIDGQNYEVSSPPPRDGEERYDPVVGHKVILFPFKSGTGYIIKQDDAKKSAAAASSSDYWEKKFGYEVDVKDPHLKLQGYLNVVSGVYGSVIGKMSSESLNPDNIEALAEIANLIVDEIYNKAIGLAQE